MNNPLAKEQREAIRKVTKFLICCGFEPAKAHLVAEAEVLAKLIAGKEV